MGEAVGFSWHCALLLHSFVENSYFALCLRSWVVVLWGWNASEIVRGSLHGVVVFPEHLPCVMLCVRHWGSRMSKRDPNPLPQRTQSPLTCPAGSCSWDLPNVFKSLGTSFSALGSQLFGIWNVLFWFWVQPQEKGFYFWSAYFQLYIPLDGISFGGIGVCTNGILSHISSLVVEMFCLREGGGLISQ